MRTRYISDSTGHWIPESEWAPQVVEGSALVMPDIKPYQSMIDGRMINSRSKHREHLREHGCIELGNEVKLPKPGIPDAAPQQRKELIRAQIDAMSQDQFKKAIKSDVNRVKWQSRD